MTQTMANSDKGGNIFKTVNTLGTLGTLVTITNQALTAADALLAPAVKSASKAIFGNKPYMSENQFSKVLPQLSNEIRVNAQFIENVLSDQNVLDALREYGNALGLSVDVMIETFKPVLSKVIDNMFEAFDKSVEKAAAGSGITASTVLEAFIGELPGIGGLMILAIAVAKAFNTIAKTVSPFIITGANSTAQVVDAFRDNEGKLHNTFADTKKTGVALQAAIRNNAIRNNPINNTVGGRRKVDKTTRRILHSLDRFSRSRISRSRFSGNRLTRKRF